MDSDTLNRLVARTFEHATRYNQDPNQQAGLLPTNLTAEQRAEVEAALAQNYAEDERFRSAVSKIITHFVDRGAIKAEGRLTFLSGANGSKQLLVSGEHPYRSAIDAARNDSIGFDFQEAKHLFTEITGESLDEYKYAKFRALFAGMDVAITEHAAENNLPQVRDNVIPSHIPAGRSPDKIRVFAVALTPDQAATEARKLGIDEGEARRNAKLFADHFTTSLRNGTMDVAILDRNLDPIFVRTNGQVIIENREALALWQDSVNPTHIEGTYRPAPPTTANAVSLARS